MLDRYRYTVAHLTDTSLSEEVVALQAESVDMERIGRESFAAGRRSEWRDSVRSLAELADMLAIVRREQVKRTLTS
jgi:hypothetical protein